MENAQFQNKNNMNAETTKTDNQNSLSNITNGLVKVSAAWCGPCKLMAPVVDQIKTDEQFKNLSFVDLDAEKDSEVLANLNIKSVPTFLFYKDGAETHRKAGLISKSSLEGLLNQFSV